MKRHYVASLVAFLVSAALLHAQPQGLVKEGDTFRHEPSKSSLKVSKDWEVVNTNNVIRQSHLGLRKAFGGVDVTVTWTKLQNPLKFDEAIELELNQLIQTYGKDKVIKKEPITIDNKSVSVIELGDGPDRNGKQVGIIYLFDAGPDANERWKVKVRAIVNKGNQEAGLKAVSDLLRQFQW